MADKGYLKLGQTSMQGIKSYMRQNPQRLAEVLGQNPSYIFFRELTGSGNDGPVGALGTPLMGNMFAQSTGTTLPWVRPYLSPPPIRLPAKPSTA